MLVEICAPVAQMDQSGRFLNLFNQFSRVLHDAYHAIK